jgi:hypothetical protein
MAEGTWKGATELPSINWRMSAALENVPRGDDEVAEVTNLEAAVRDWLQLDGELQAEAVLTPEHPIKLNEGEPIVSFSGLAIRDLADRLPD